MKKKLTIFIFIILAFTFPVSFFSFAAEIQDGNFTIVLSEIEYTLTDGSSEYLDFDQSNSILQCNSSGTWSLRSSSGYVPSFRYFTDLRFYFELLDFPEYTLLSFDLNYTVESLLNNSFNWYINSEKYNISANSSDVLSFYMDETESWSDLTFQIVANDFGQSPSITRLVFTFDNFYADNQPIDVDYTVILNDMNDNLSVIVEQNDEIVSQLEVVDGHIVDLLDKTDDVIDRADSILDILEDDSATPDADLDFFQEGIAEAADEIADFFVTVPDPVLSIPSSTLQDVGELSGLASSVIACINMTNNPYLQAAGRQNYVKSEIGWYWPMLVFTSGFCLVASLLARKGRSLSPDPAESQIDSSSEGSDEIITERSKWDPKSGSWKHIGTYRNSSRSFGSHSSKRSRK